MPGYYLHLAACKESSLENRSFVLGVEAPDMLKKHVKFCGGIEAARTKYESLRTSEMPEYGELQPRILQKENAENNDGLHYGFSSNPDIKECWSGLSEKQKTNPFYRGYVWHLLTDAIMYGRLDIETKLKKVLQDHQESSDIDELYKAERQKLHDDWNKTNALVRETYPEVTLTEEVKELGVVKFITEGELVYVDWDLLRDTIDYLRNFDPLNGDMDSIIKEVMESI